MVVDEFALLIKLFARYFAIDSVFIKYKSAFISHTL